MAAFKVPSTGLLLRHDPNSLSSDKIPTQVIRLNLVANVAQDLIRSLKQNDTVRLRGGKKPVVQFGKKSLPLETSPDTFPSDLYTTSPDNNGQLYFSGKLSHTLELEKADQVTAKSDQALAALESTLKSIQEQRASNETSIIGSKGDKRKDKGVSPLLSQNSSLRKDHLLGGIARSTPSSPFLSASFSPRQGPTSAPLASGISAKDQIRLDAIRKPLIHLLAIKPLTSRGVAEKLRAPRDDVEKVLDKVARDTKVGDGRKELKEKSFRELDVWEFKYRTEDDRQSAINNAIGAFDRTRVDKKDNLWQLLLPKEERGQGKCLSRLNFEKPPPVPSSATPRPGDDGNESKAEMSDREQIRTKAKKDTAATSKKAKEKSVPTKTPARADNPPASRVKESPSKQAKPDGKFKSSERIEDSDEDADAAEEQVIKTKQSQAAKAGPGPVTKKKPDQGLSRPPTPAHPISANKTVHKSSLSNSSSSSSSSNEKPRFTATGAKTLKPHPSPDPSAATSRISPRPRHGSSPQKPSPLGSSPPTTSTDVSNSGSSKASNQSSAPSSPPSGSDMLKPKQQTNNKYSPIITSDPSKSRNVSRGRSPPRKKIEPADEERPTKRKAEVEDDRPTKRQQATPSHSHQKSLSNGTAPRLPQVNGSTRQNTDGASVRSSSPEKPGPQRATILRDAKRFQRYYRTYKELYERISLMDEKEREDKDMLDLWKMHKRLKEMKADIWGSWDKVENVEKIGKVDKAIRQAVAAG